MVFKKCRENPSDVLFLDASQFFDKATNQNILRERDILKIIDTYRNWSTQDKYSAVVKVETIKENDFNLNIAKYIDTFENESSIDIVTISKEIKALDQKIHDVDEKILLLCNELNIPTPF